MSQPAAITAAVKDLLARWGHLDILVNNAGTAYYGPLQTMPDAVSDQILAVNLLAPIQLVRELLPALQARGEGPPASSSILGSLRHGSLPLIKPEKIRLWSGYRRRSLREFGGRTFGVTTLCPGFVRTPMLGNYAGGQDQRHTVPAWASTSAERVADAAIRAIYANKAIVVLPWSATLLWWATRIAPNGMAWLMRQGWRK